MRLRCLGAGTHAGSSPLSDDVLLLADDSSSTIPADDLALAVVDEVEEPRRSRRRFHAALR